MQIREMLKALTDSQCLSKLSRWERVFVLTVDKFGIKKLSRKQFDKLCQIHERVFPVPEDFSYYDKV